MLLSEALEVFGTKTALARALGIRTPSVYGWGDEVPPLRQLQLERLTGGRLRADDDVRTPPVRMPDANDEAHA